MVFDLFDHFQLHVHVPAASPAVLQCTHNIDNKKKIPENPLQATTKMIV